MELLYKSTRDADKTVTASQAILKGLASDGGLFVPVEIPKLDVDLDELKEMSYQETAYQVMKRFLTDFTEEELRHCINSAYDEKFDTTEIAPLVEVNDGVFHLELFHGATIAFKDMALSILPHLMTTAAKKNHADHEIVILTATSGDTGKAAMAGFADVPGTKIIVFYPKNGVSRVQELQMVTQKGANTAVVAIHGNYVYAYAKLLQKGEIAKGEEINVTVPTGNFGNILAAYYAKQMGLPIAKLICASNENKVLFDFFETGVYDKNRDFVLTSSPSMDILISSNLERLIYQVAGQDAQKDCELMKALNTEGKYEITGEMKAGLKDFVGGYATEEQTSQAIHDTYQRNGYVMDTHTAVASYVSEQYRKETGDAKKMVVASTASPYKFARSVMTSIDSKYEGMDDFALIEELKIVSGVEIPNAVKEIMDAKVLHNRECDVDQMEQTVKAILKVEA